MTAPVVSHLHRLQKLFGLVAHTYSFFLAQIKHAMCNAHVAHELQTEPVAHTTLFFILAQVEHIGQELSCRDVAQFTQFDYT